MSPVIFSWEISVFRVGSLPVPGRQTFEPFLLLICQWSSVNQLVQEFLAKGHRTKRLRSHFHSLKICCSVFFSFSLNFTAGKMWVRGSGTRHLWCTSGFFFMVSTGPFLHCCVPRLGSSYLSGDLLSSANSPLRTKFRICPVGAN